MSPVMSEQFKDILRSAFGCSRWNEAEMEYWRCGFELAEIRGGGGCGRGLNKEQQGCQSCSHRRVLSWAYVLVKSHRAMGLADAQGEISCSISTSLCAFPRLSPPTSLRTQHSRRSVGEDADSIGEVHLSVIPKKKKKVMFKRERLSSILRFDILLRPFNDKGV